MSEHEAQSKFQTSFILHPLLLLALQPFASQRDICYPPLSKDDAHWSIR